MNKGVFIINKHQFITHTIELIDEKHPSIAQFQLSLMLLVPSSYIATDIRSGFPNLISNERLNIDQLVIDKFEEYNQDNHCRTMRPLVYADNFLKLIEDDLLNYYNYHHEIELASCNIMLYTDITSTTNVKLYSTKLDDTHDIQ
ncbi:hypothetical protein HYQ40_01755 [Aerococcaceae bacterium DSM 111021]|nr:hypothetical protein [Aerococcaceae bacterium DSM 111021]